MHRTLLLVWCIAAGCGSAEHQVSISFLYGGEQDYHLLVVTDTSLLVSPASPDSLSQTRSIPFSSIDRVYYRKSDGTFGAIIGTVLGATGGFAIGLTSGMGGHSDWSPIFGGLLAGGLTGGIAGLLIGRSPTPYDPAYPPDRETLRSYALHPSVR